MKKNKIVGALALVMLGINPAFAAENKTTDFQASAEIENTCLIEADDVNFGQVYAPLTQQGTKSEMRVLCSKGASYTVDLNYGGNFVDPGASSSSNQYTAKLSYTTTKEYQKETGVVISSYRIFNSNDTPIGNGSPYSGVDTYSHDYNLLGDDNIGDFYCSNYNGGTGYIYIRTLDAANLFGTESIGKHPDNMNLCSNGVLSQSNWSTKLGTSINDKGAMVGAVRGSSLAYQITLPGDISKPWISNVNSYQAQGTGEFDKIEVNARIMPDSSSSLYPAQDSYFDTVTVVISY